MRTSLSPQQRDYLERADRSAHSLLRQIDSILDYVRLEAGDLQTLHLAFNLEDVIEGVVDTAIHAAGDKPLTVRLERDPNIPDALAGDAQRLGQVLTTLADTIVKTADAGEIIIGARLLGIDAGRAQIAFEVGCTGRGLNHPRQSPQYNADSTDKAAVGNAAAPISASASAIGWWPCWAGDCRSSGARLKGASASASRCRLRWPPTSSRATHRAPPSNSPKSSHQAKTPAGRATPSAHGSDRR